MDGAVLDTHAVYWLVSGEKELTEEALVAIGQAQDARTLFVSPISAWELAIATQKPKAVDRPHLGDIPPDRWFRAAIRAAAARVVPAQQRIACEAAAVAVATGHKDPGDCFLIATARLKALPLITRDQTIIDLADALSDYLSVIRC